MNGGRGPGIWIYQTKQRSDFHDYINEMMKASIGWVHLTAIGLVSFGWFEWGVDSG